jgi:hypothetical protein
MFKSRIDYNGLGQGPETIFYEDGKLNLATVNIRPQNTGNFFIMCMDNSKSLCHII